MKKLLSISYSASAFNLALLILRIGAGVLLMAHGYDKLVHFADYQKQFMSFLGLGSSFSLALVVFSEFFCSIFVIVGLFTRFVSIPILIGLSVALFKAHHADFFDTGEHASLFILAFITILLVGPGKVSVDGLINK